MAGRSIPDAALYRICPCVGAPFDALIGAIVATSGAAPGEVRLMMRRLWQLSLQRPAQRCTGFARASARRRRRAL